MPKPIPQSVLSLDIGRKRIGLAGCDPFGITVTRLPALFKKTFQVDLTKLKTYCKNRNVKGLIIGIPLDKNGKETYQSNFCQQYGKRLGYALQLPIAWVNEHSSTWEACKRSKLPSNDRSGKLDSEAAALLLEQWLNEGPELTFEKEISKPGSKISPEATSNFI